MTNQEKIIALRACIDRAARVAPWTAVYGLLPECTRFVRLWKARNRRTRVLMKRRRDAEFKSGDCRVTFTV